MFGGFGGFMLTWKRLREVFRIEQWCRRLEMDNKVILVDDEVKVLPAVEVGHD